MSLRLLADENVEHRIADRLAQYGHDVEHVDSVSELGKGSADAAIADYSRSTDRLIVTSDEDFLTAFGPGDYRGLLFIEDEQLSTKEIVEIIDSIAETIDRDRIQSILYVTPTWLSEYRGSTGTSAPGCKWIHRDRPEGPHEENGPERSLEEKLPQRWNPSRADGSCLSTASDD